MASAVEGVQLLDVAGHIYRIRTQPITGTKSSKGRPAAAAQQPVHDWQEEEELEILTLEDAEIDESLITQQGDSFITQLAVDSQLLPFIIGRGGSTKKQLEQETGATLLIPRGSPAKQPQQQQQQQVLVGSSQSETITIKANSKQAVSSARVRTQLLIDSVINSQMLDFTHFVSIPLANKHTAAKLQEFQTKVLSQPDAEQQGLDASIFIPPAHLHLTLLMLKLYSDEARHKAAQALQGIQPQVQQLLGGQPLRLSLRGLDYMSDDPTDMHVLYLKVKDLTAGQVLTALCDLVVRAFEDAGLVLPGQRSDVKLHATIINTRHRRPGDRGEQQQQQQQQQRKQQFLERRGFNGQQLLKDWAGDQLDLGEFDVPALHISQRGQYDRDTGFYACAAEMQL